ncbi:type IX secretion system protein PorD [Brumimicrobium mesophilum]|uniref:type IX secretion system protein PorD n=1 Tax=Brumimicrobium mesophilum TaxID=392717 RepID=UPI000D1427A2|nr:DUF4835 family protein [Brumimicrobium mesophilum]
MKFILTIISLLSILYVSGQELNCQVNVVTKPGVDITTTEQEVLSELEQSIFELMNSTSWTKDQYEVEERINCVFQLSITKVSGNGVFEGSLQVQATRPVYNSTYNTTLINFLDEDVSFAYQRNAQILFSENQFTSNLTSILAFYAYYIIGLDADSFSLRAGDPNFNKAQNIVTLAQSGGGLGWRSSEKGRRNRYWLIDNTLQELFSPLRETFYEYHRDGLDNMFNNQELAKTNISAAVNKLLAVNNSRPGSVNILNFVQSKRDELKGIYGEADRKQKIELVNTLKRLDPANSSKYQEILE